MKVHGKTCTEGSHHHPGPHDPSLGLRDITTLTSHLLIRPVFLWQINYTFLFAFIYTRDSTSSFLSFWLTLKISPYQSIFVYRNLSCSNSCMVSLGDSIKGGRYTSIKDINIDMHTTVTTILSPELSRHLKLQLSHWTSSLPRPGSHYCMFCPVTLPVPGKSYKGYHSTYGSHFFHLTCLQGSSVSQHMSELASFFRLNNILLGVHSVFAYPLIPSTTPCTFGLIPPFGFN